MTTPQIDAACLADIDRHRLLTPAISTHPPRILILYGSLRARSFSRLSGEEAGRILHRLGAEVRFFNPSGLPLVDDGVDATHPKVRELRDLVAWCEGMVWSSPERHGAMTGLMKTQIDWIPLSEGAVRPTQGKTLAVMQVSGGSQSFNAREPDAHPWPLDAAADDPQPVLDPQGVSGIRRGGPDAPLAALRPDCGRDGRVGEVHAADPRPRRIIWWIAIPNARKPPRRLMKRVNLSAAT